MLLSPAMQQLAVDHEVTWDLGLPTHAGSRFRYHAGETLKHDHQYPVAELPEAILPKAEWDAVLANVFAESRGEWDAAVAAADVDAMWWVIEHVAHKYHT